jgi:hypothetical protein
MSMYRVKNTTLKSCDLNGVITDAIRVNIPTGERISSIGSSVIK